MAHADYDCCAVCDSKMNYSYDAQTKQQICTNCAVNLAQRGVFVHNVAELMAWMKAEKPAKVLDDLVACQFKTCRYGNDVDDLYDKLLGGGGNEEAK